MMFDLFEPSPPSDDAEKPGGESGQVPDKQAGKPTLKIVK
jgi:hypothetical protein